MTHVNNPTDDLQRVTYPRCLPPRIHYLLSRHTYVRNQLRTPFISISRIYRDEKFQRSSFRRKGHVQNPVQRSFLLFLLLEIDQRIGFFFFYYTVFNFSNETHFVRKTSFVHRSGRGSFRFFETEFAEAGYRFEKNDHPVLHANYGKTEERRVHGPILRRNSTGSAERIFACTAFTVSPRCKSTVITMSLHHVTRIRSSNFCFCECASHVRAWRLAWKAHESTHARFASSSSFETR